MTDQLWFRRVVIVAAAGMLVGLTATLAIRVVRANDNVTAKLAEFELEAVPPEDNAAEWLRAGAAAVVWSQADSGAAAGGSLSPSAEWSPELEAAVRETLDRQAGALETMHRAATMERSSYGIGDPQGAAARMPDMLSLIKACRLLIAEARVAAADGDEDAAITALATAGKMATTLERESSILTALIGIACERMMLLAAAETLTSGHPWTRQSSFLDGLEDTLSTEDLADTMHRSWTFETFRGADSGATAELAADDVERALAFLSELMEMPYGRATERFREVDRDDVQISLIVIHMSNAIARAQAALAQRQLVRAAIELRRIGLADGAYPTDRAAVAELTEPDPFTGQPLLYEVREDGSAEVAIDGVDELLAQVVAKGMVEKGGAHVPPIVLPAP